MTPENEQRFVALLANCANGQHVWRYWKGNEVVDKLTFQPTNIRTMVYYANGEQPHHRGCVICGKIENQHSKWESVPT